MKVQARSVDVKRHTVGWKIGGKWRSRNEAVKLAKQGKIDGVAVRSGGKDENYIVSLPGESRLYDLPVKRSVNNKKNRRTNK